MPRVAGQSWPPEGCLPEGGGQRRHKVVSENLFGTRLEDPDPITLSIRVAMDQRAQCPREE